MYVVQKIVGTLAMPLVLSLILVGAAIVLHMRRPLRGGRYLLIVAAALAYLSSTNVVGDLLIGPLERRYPPLIDGTVAATIRYVVVLGSGYDPRRGVPITAALDAEGLARAVEGIRLARGLPGARLVFSGGSSASGRAPAAGYGRLARELGVSDRSFAMLDRALDTGDEAREIVTLLHEEPFLLVTSASHMPRAMLYLKRAGAHPTAAPTAQSAGVASILSWRAWLPNAAGLRKTESAVHEYLGLLAAAMGIE